MDRKVTVSHARLWAGVAVFVGLGGVVAVAAALFWPIGPAAMIERSSGLSRDEPDPDLIDIRSPPVNIPDGHSYTADDLPPDAPVIGVSVGDKHRAYALAAFEDVSRHVVNDLLAGRPVSVTYCPRTGCTRVFTDQGMTRLRLAVGGWYEKLGVSQMVIRIGRERYQQETGRELAGRGTLPYPTLGHEVTTWGAWHKAHPDSDVYTGGGVVGY
ncbi:MAG: DUF3179 domain-containing protein [Fimbriiglobus sp.]|nr:DUF3179 domain-containing protein [Fimbriiglobus sp.]